MSLNNRLLNVLAGLMNLTTIISLLSLLILPMVWQYKLIDEAHIALVIFVSIVLGVVATINYISLGRFRIWNKLPAN
jgi:hypothetical protein